MGQVGQDRVGNISLKLLLKIPHVIFAHTVHMPNVAYHSIIKPLWSLTFWLKNERALHQLYIRKPTKFIKGLLN